MIYENPLMVKNIIPLVSNGYTFKPAIEKMLVDPLDCLQLTKNGYYELLITEIEKTLIKKGDIVLNIGACIGYHSLIMSKLVGDNGKVYAFEPEPRNMDLLIRNIKLNNCTNIIPIQKCVSDKNQFISLYLAKDNVGDHRIYDTHDNREAIEVESVIVHDYFNYVGHSRKIDFIKMDIQGSEGLAIQGISKIIRDNKKLTMITEFQPKGLLLSGVQPESFIQTLLDSKFSLYSINEIENKVEPLNVSELLVNYTPDKDDETDILCIKDI